MCRNTGNTYSGVRKEIMKRIILQKRKKNQGAYSPELSSFGMTLKYYSSKAYRLGLPSPSVIRPWYSKIEGDPTFINPTFSALAAKVSASKQTGEKVICSLMLDEMSLKNTLSGMARNTRGLLILELDCKMIHCQLHQILLSFWL